MKKIVVVMAMLAATLLASLVGGATASADTRDAVCATSRVSHVVDCAERGQVTGVGETRSAPRGVVQSQGTTKGSPIAVVTNPASAWSGRWDGGPWHNWPPM